jgi:hypothetical protein
MDAGSVSANAYAFLLDTYETEVLKTLTIWSAFADDAMTFTPATKSRTVLQQIDHQIQSEGGWMLKMFGIDVGDFQPKEKTKGRMHRKISHRRGEALGDSAPEAGKLVARNDRVFRCAALPRVDLHAAAQSFHAPSRATHHLPARTWSESALGVRAHRRHEWRGDLPVLTAGAFFRYTRRIRISPEVPQ